MEVAEFFIRFSLIKGIPWRHLTTRHLFPAAMQHGDLVSHFKKMRMNGKQIEQFFAVPAQQIKASMEWLKQSNCYLIDYWHSYYPPILKTINDAPLVLFAMGNIELLSKPQIAIVGSRKCTPNGAYYARQFSRFLSSRLVITSGLALGIDACCHQSALAVGGATLAVLGSGHLHIGPASNRSLAKQIITQNGALISEFIPPYVAKPHSFPRRNRLISGLSLATLIIESSLKSGSLTTAYHALNQGREVFVLAHAVSTGNAALIEEGATSVRAPSEIMAALATSELRCFVRP